MEQQNDMKVFFGRALTRIIFETFIKGGHVADSLVERPIPGVRVVEPLPMTREEFERVHDPAYVAAVIDGDPAHLAWSNGRGWDEGLFESVAISNGAVRDAALEAYRTRGNSGALSSGLHHAKYEHGEGYCTFNGLVAAALAVLDAGGTRVVILDLDAHCGGGTAQLIEGRDGIEQVDVSVNRYDWYADTANARLAIATGANYLEVIERELGKIADPSSIDLLIFNAGMDPHERATGASGITTDVIAERERMVYAWAWAHQSPVAFTLAGGYLSGGATMDELVDLHRVTIATAAAVA
jgi:acetoin utilization deacetylase AcuC-like enzyme